MNISNNIIITKLNGKIFQYFVSFKASENDFTNETHETEFSFEHIPCDSNEISIEFTHKNTSFEKYQNTKKSTKTVQFNLKPKTYTMYTWSFAYKEARKDKWQQMARDRSRFKDRINKLDEIISPILNSQWNLTHTHLCE